MFSRRRTGFIVVFSFVVMSMACASSNHGAWRFLGQASAQKGGDRDEIHVGAREGTFAKIQLRVTGSPVEIRNVRVHYENGAVDEVEIRKTIAAGGETRVIDLRGSNRVIEKVVFRYETPLRARGQATVALFGRR